MPSHPQRCRRVRGLPPCSDTDRDRGGTLQSSMGVAYQTQALPARKTRRERKGKMSAFFTKRVSAKTQRLPKAQLVCVILILCPVVGHAQEPNPIRLPMPQTDIGRPLMQVLKDRSSTRTFSPARLPAQTVSNLLWAAFGVNRPDSGKRTAPSAMNWQETDIYVATADGLYIYDAKTQQLDAVSRDDVGAWTGTQSFVKDAPLNLVYVADLAKTGSATAERDMYVAADVGFIAQNVYLFCASAGLVTVVRGSIDRAALSRVMRLRPGPEGHPGTDGGLSEKVTGRADKPVG